MSYPENIRLRHCCISLFATKGKISGLLLIIPLLLLICSQNASALQANASASWAFSDFDPVTANGNAGTGNFTVGRDVATVSGAGTVTQPVPPAPISFPYAANAGAGPVGFTATLSAGGTTATATSTMTVANPVGSYYPWTLNLNANVTRNSIFSPAGTATAPGSDPDYFDPAAIQLNPIFQEKVTLGAGSSVFEEDQHDEAFTKMSRDSSLLTNPIFFISILGLGNGLIDATVYFNPDPSLTFSTTATALESLLESSTGLGTAGGLASDLSFDYTWDLSHFNVSAADTIGGGGISYAASAPVPEPGTFLLMAIGGLGMLGWLRRRS